MIVKQRRDETDYVVNSENLFNGTFKKKNSQNSQKVKILYHSFVVLLVKKIVFRWANLNRKLKKKVPNTAPRSNFVTKVVNSL